MDGTRGDTGPARRVSISAAEALLEGDLELPPDARGVVLFPHGRGSSRGPNDALVALQLREAGLGTLLLSLLTAAEQKLDARIACFRFDIELLTGRLAAATDWLAEEPATGGLPIGYLGASNGAAAALAAAAERVATVGAVVALGGRPDLAERALARVAALTLLIVGGNDEELIGLNRTGLKQLGAGARQLAIVPGATHLFEEPGALEEAIRLAREWFTAHLIRPAGAGRAERTT